MIQFQKVVSDVNLVLPDLCFNSSSIKFGVSLDALITNVMWVVYIHLAEVVFFFFLTFPVGF